MPNPTKITIEITDNKNFEEVVADYRWWTREIDSFKVTTIGGLNFSGATWKYIMKHGAKHLGKAEFF